jgi:hypothetical protein
VNYTYEQVRDLRELPSRILFFLLAGDYSMRVSHISYFTKKKKGFQNRVFKMRSGGKYPPAVFYIYIYIYIYIKERKDGNSIYTRFLSIFFLKLKKGFYGRDSSISLNVSEIRHSSVCQPPAIESALEQGGT